MASSPNATWVRKVHFSFGFFDNSMPESIKAVIDKVTKDHPEWTVKVWGPEESRALINRVDPGFLEVYDNYAYAIQRSDASRYYILEDEGGLYMDLDYVLKVNLDVILDYLAETHPRGGVFLNGTPNNIGKRQVSNSFMYASAPGYGFWKFVRRALREKHRSWRAVRYAHIMYSTGPMLVTHALREWTKTKSSVEEADKEVVILDTSVFNPCGLCSHPYHCSEGKDVLAFHRNAGSWSLNSTANLMRSCYCSPKPWAAFVVIVVLLLVSVVLFVRCRWFKGCPPCERALAAKPKPGS